MCLESLTQKITSAADPTNHFVGVTREPVMRWLVVTCAIRHYILTMLVDSLAHMHAGGCTSMCLMASFAFSWVVKTISGAIATHTLT